MSDPIQDDRKLQGDGSSGMSTTGSSGGASAEYGDGRTRQDVGEMSQSSDFDNDTVTDGDEALGTTDETSELISADKVQGTAVYDSAGERLGTVDSMMIDKMGGHVEYVVLASGGFLGIGERYQPLPWDVLSYDTDLGGYRVDRSMDTMRSAPNYSRDEVDSYDYGSRGRDIDDWYDSSGKAATQSSTMPSSGLGSGSAIGAGNSGSGGTMGGTGATGGVGSSGRPI